LDKQKKSDKKTKSELQSFKYNFFYMKCVCLEPVIHRNEKRLLVKFLFYSFLLDQKILFLFFCLDTKESKSQGCLNFYCFLRRENPRKQTPRPDFKSVLVKQRFLSTTHRYFRFLENYIKIQKANQNIYLPGRCSFEKLFLPYFLIPLI
jgi:hypothetical protein